MARKWSQRRDCIWLCSNHPKKWQKRTNYTNDKTIKATVVWFVAFLSFMFLLLLSTHAFSRGMSYDLAYLAWKSMFRLFTPLPVFAALDTGPVCKPLDFNFVQPTMKKTTSNKPTNRSQAYTLLENNCYIYGELWNVISCQWVRSSSKIKDIYPHKPNVSDN